jgi:hypothetical protein
MDEHSVGAISDLGPIGGGAPLAASMGMQSRRRLGALRLKEESARVGLYAQSEGERETVSGGSQAVGVMWIVRPAGPTGRLA